MADLEGVDPDLFRSLKWIMENEEGVDDLEMTFSAEMENFGVRTTVDFLQGASALPWPAPHCGRRG